MLSILLSSCASQQENIEASSPQTSESSSRSISQAQEANAAPAPYEIVKTDDGSMKAMERSLSTYSVEELSALPTNKKMIYRVVIDFQEGTQAEAEATVRKVVSDLTEQDGDIDEISLLLYSDAELAGSAFDVGSATWAPKGELGNMTPQIASTNNRSTYALSIDVRDDLQEYLEQRGKEETVFGMSEAERRQFFKEIVAAEDRAHAEAEEKYPTNMNNSKWNKDTAMDDLMNNADLSSQLADKYRAAVRAKYNLTKEQQSEITSEALREEWPLD